MKELGITKGEWRIDMADAIKIKAEDGSNIAILTHLTNFKRRDTDEVERNALLIADTGNIAQKCGLLPSELLQQRDELKEALLEAVKTIRIWHGFMEAHPTEMKAWEYYQQSPEMKKINAAIKNTETK